MQVASATALHPLIRFLRVMTPLRFATGDYFVFVGPPLLYLRRVSDLITIREYKRGYACTAGASQNADSDLRHASGILGLIIGSTHRSQHGAEIEVTEIAGGGAILGVTLVIPCAAGRKLGSKISQELIEPRALSVIHQRIRQILLCRVDMFLDLGRVQSRRSIRHA